MKSAGARRLVELAEQGIFAVPLARHVLSDVQEDPNSAITILIRDLSVRTVIGVPEDERRQAQPILLDLDIELDANRAAHTDDLGDTVDYAAVVDDLRGCLAGKNYFLLERLAEFVAGRILDEFGARRVRVKAAKVGILEDVGLVGVVITRSRPRQKSVL